MEKIEELTPENRKFMEKQNPDAVMFVDKINEIIDWINDHKDQLLQSPPTQL
jgi:hypothetical protein